MNEWSIDLFHPSYACHFIFPRETYENQQKKLEEVKKAHSFGVEILKFKNRTLTQERSLGDFIIDIKEIGFKCGLSAAKSGYFEIYIKVKFFWFDTNTYRLKINLRSLSSIVRALVDKAKDLF